MPRLAALLLVLLIAAPAAARPPLAENEPIIRQLFAAAVGDRIRKTCPTISAKMLLVMTKAAALERYALDQGYTPEEIDAFLNDKAERARMDARVDAYLAERGVRPGDAEDHCRVGEAEIAENSPMGELLRSR